MTARSPTRSLDFVSMGMNVPRLKEKHCVRGEQETTRSDGRGNIVEVNLGIQRYEFANATALNRRRQDGVQRISNDGRRRMSASVANTARFKTPSMPLVC